jgi:hypothetical protein
MSGLADDAKDAGDKMKAGAKAAGKKMEDPDRDASTEYNKEKVKEKVEDRNVISPSYIRMRAKQVFQPSVPRTFVI